MHYDDKVITRLKKVEGQVRAIRRMMEEHRDCKEVVTQLSAVRSGVDRTIGVVVTDNLLECIAKAEGDDVQVNELVQQAMNLVIKSR